MLKAWKEFSSDTLIWRSSFRWSQCLVCSGGSADRSLSVSVAVRVCARSLLWSAVTMWSRGGSVGHCHCLHDIISYLRYAWPTPPAPLQWNSERNHTAFLDLVEIEIWTWELLSFLYFHRQFVFVASLAEINYYSSNWLTHLPQP